MHETIAAWAQLFQVCLFVIFCYLFVVVVCYHISSNIERKNEDVYEDEVDDKYGDLLPLQKRMSDRRGVQVRIWTQTDKRYGPLRWPSSSSCGGL